MPHLSRICIYPIKSLPGVSVSKAALTANGALANDREYMLRGADGIINGKRDARIHRLAAKCSIVDGAVRITLGTGAGAETFTLNDLSQRAQLQTRLTQFFGEPVHIDRDTRGGFPDDPDAPGPTIVSEGSLAAVASWYPGHPVDDIRRRFRANLEIADCPAFWEDRLFGAPGETVSFRIGDAYLIGITPCKRCIVPTRDPASGCQQAGFQRTFVQQRRATLPVWTNRERFEFFYRFATNTRAAGHLEGTTIRVGDAVQILQAAAQAR